MRSQAELGSSGSFFISPASTGASPITPPPHHGSSGGAPARWLQAARLLPWPLRATKVPSPGSQVGVLSPFLTQPHGHSVEFLSPSVGPGLPGARQGHRPSSPRKGVIVTRRTCWRGGWRRWDPLWEAVQAGGVLAIFRCFRVNVADTCSHGPLSCPSSKKDPPHPKSFPFM